MTDLSGRVALVTGAASGLGRATARALATVGAEVMVADIDKHGMSETVRLIKDDGGYAVGQYLDVTDEESRRRAVWDTHRTRGEAFDILINVAGIDLPGNINDVDLDDFRKVFAVNNEGPIFLIRDFIQTLEGRQTDRLAEIVNIISISAITVGAGAVSYNGSKAALAKATQVFQQEIWKDQYPCRLQGIMPAAMNTPMMKQWGLAEELMMPPEVVAAEIVHALGRHPAVYAQNLVIVPRTEPNFPR